MAHAGKALYHQERNSKIQYFQESWQSELCVHSKVIIYSFVWLFFSTNIYEMFTLSDILPDT